MRVAERLDREQGALERERPLCAAALGHGMQGLSGQPKREAPAFGKAERARFDQGQVVAGGPTRIGDQHRPQHAGHPLVGGGPVLSWIGRVDLKTDRALRAALKPNAGKSRPLVIWMGRDAGAVAH